MEFRPRDYITERETHALHRSLTDDHPLSNLTPSLHNQIVVVKSKGDDPNFFDPLRAHDVNAGGMVKEEADNANIGVFKEAIKETPLKEWTSFKRFLMQKFPVSKMISISSISDFITKGGKVLEKSSKSTKLEELDDTEKFLEEDAKVITKQEYVSRLHELKDEICCAWNAEDRVRALKLSIKVAKLLMDTSVMRFYPTLFVLATDILDMLGDMVWSRIQKKAEYAADGSFRCSLPENFTASDICSDAKETCYNWFCKVGSVQELLPRIYLELAILRCWRFLHDNPLDSLQRLVMMIRGLADPLASSYCRLYLAHCARKMPALDTGYLVACVNDIEVLMLRLLSVEGCASGHSVDNRRLLISLMEPSIEYIVKSVFDDASQRQVQDVLLELGVLGKAKSVGDSRSVSITLHHLLKELPIEVVSDNAVDILHLINCCNDYSVDQCLNYRLLGLRLCESGCQMDIVNSVMDEVVQVLTRFDRLDEYSKIVDAYMDIILQNHMDKYLNTVLEGLSLRAINKEMVEDELGNLQSILMKILTHFKDLDHVLSLNHFLEVLDVMHGNSRTVVNMQILNMATRNTYIHDQTLIQLLFEISQSLHDSIDFAFMKDDDPQHPARLISRFIQMVEYDAQLEQHLMFLVDCRGAFGSISELKETLVHSCNCLAIKALKKNDQVLDFVKSCIAFSEVTIPSISSPHGQFNLYLETAEVALLGGLVSHLEGLIVAAISTLESIESTDSRVPSDIDGLLSSIRKLCSLLVIVPGNADQGVMKIPKSILSLVYNHSWVTPTMKTRIFCSIVLLLATLSQKKLPYHANYSEILANDTLFFGDSSYTHELVSLSKCVVQNLVDSIEQEQSKTTRGKTALEACNCIASTFTASDDVMRICSKLVEIAKLSLSSKDRYLQSTVKYLEEQIPAFRATQSVMV